MAGVGRKRALVAACGVVLSAAGGVAAERWALAGVDPFYFAAAQPSPDRSALTPVAAQEPKDAATATDASPLPDYAAMPLGSNSPAPVMDADDERWQRRIDADERRWQARMDADFRRQQRQADEALSGGNREADDGPATEGPSDRSDGPATQPNPDPALAPDAPTTISAPA